MDKLTTIEEIKSKLAELEAELEVNSDEIDEDSEKELDELVDFDGSISGSKIPNGYKNNATISQSKTTDQVVPATRQGGEQGKGYYFKRYWGESIEEMDKSSVLGVEETDQLPFDDAVEYYEEDLGMEKDEAVDRVETERGPEELENDKVKGSFTRRRLTEKEKLDKIAEDKAKEVLEVILNSKSDDGDIRNDEDIEDEMLDKKLTYLKKYMDKKGYSVNDIIKKLK